MAEPARNSDINSLDPNFRQKFDLFWKEVKAFRPDAVVFEARRTLERQKYLYSIGRTILKGQRPVSWTLQSKHLEGNAVDIVFTDDEATPKIENRPMWKGPYDKLIVIAQKYGISNLYPTETCHFQDNGRPLSIINIIMNFYKNLRTTQYEKLTPDQRVFSHPDQAFDRIRGLPQDQQLEELIYLLAILAQKAK